MQKQPWDPLRTRLALLPTATAAPSSIPSRLWADAARDPAEAGKQLVALVATAPSQALAAPVQVFNARPALPQQQFVPAIVVLDASSPVSNLERACKSRGLLGSRCGCGRQQSLNRSRVKGAAPTGAVAGLVQLVGHLLQRVPLGPEQLH